MGADLEDIKWTASVLTFHTLSSELNPISVRACPKPKEGAPKVQGKACATGGGGGFRLDHHCTNLHNKAEKDKFEKDKRMMGAYGYCT